MNVNIEPTAEAINGMAAKMKECAEDLARIAARMRAGGEIELAGEAASTVANLLPNLRLDLLIHRPIRALQARAQVNPGNGVANA